MKNINGQGNEITIILPHKKIDCISSRQNQLLKQQNEKITKQKGQLIQMSKKVQELTVDKLAFFTNITHESVSYTHLFNQIQCILYIRIKFGQADLLVGVILILAYQSAVQNRQRFGAYMTDPGATSLGVGVTKDNGVTYCYLFLGKPKTNNPYG